MPPWSVSSPTRGSRRLWRTAAIDCLEPAAAPCRSIVLSELGIHTEAQPPYRRRNRREMVCQDDSNAGRRCSAAPAARRPTLSRVRNPLGQQPDQTTAAAGRRRLLRPPARPRSTCCFRSLTSNTLIAGAAMFDRFAHDPDSILAVLRETTATMQLSHCWLTVRISAPPEASVRSDDRGC